jgi:hypothetical protein
MSWEMGLVTRLLADPDVAALVGENVEWDARTPDGSLPAIMLQTITDARPQTNDGFDDYRPSRVQLNCLAKTKAEATALRDAAIAALVPSAFAEGTDFLRSFVDDGGSDAEQTPTGRICRERTDLIIWHN